MDLKIENTSTPAGLDKVLNKNPVSLHKHFLNY